MARASDYFPIEIAKKLWSIFNIHPDEIMVAPGSQPHLYHEKTLLGYMDGRFGPYLWVNNPDYRPGRERVDYPKHRQWHPVFNLTHGDSCACRGPECVPNWEEWKPPILERRKFAINNINQQD